MHAHFGGSQHAAAAAAQDVPWMLAHGLGGPLYLSPLSHSILSPPHPPIPATPRALFQAGYPCCCVKQRQMVAQAAKLATARA